MTEIHLSVRDLHKTFHPGLFESSIEVLKGLSFEVARGEIFGFLGPNGAGKTTTIKAITEIIYPDKGEIRVCGLPHTSLEAKRRLGFMTESPYVYRHLTGREYLRFSGELMGLDRAEIEDRISRTLSRVGMGRRADRTMGTYSKGMLQRVALAQALLGDPELLILDEPMSGLDPNQASEIRELIREIGRERTVILSTHNLAEVRVTCGRVLIISQGELVADDTPDELAARGGKPRFVATLRQNGHSPSDIREAFSVIGDAQSVKEQTGAAAGEVVVEVVPKGNQDLRADIFQAAVSANLVLLGLEQRGENLEDIFRQLTTGTGAST